MKCIIDNNKGLTLMEVIAVMVLVGILTAAVGTGLVQVVQGMIFSKMNAVTIQKGQIAMTKLVKEFTNINISAITTADATSITFASVKNGESGAHTVTLSGSTITFDGDVLTDQVDSFILRYYDNYDSTAQTTWQSSRRIIEITLRLKGADDVVTEFTERVKPRNL
ncbi:MAG TPA: prepilin-type N-terminal cleavage/methylation domain-containing protein [Chitinispirillaceae bacterium]|nr:prepilin-type N-terminal cleavage/methylation domain-containing protein [Chitinispirillaceae bacterium]